MVIPKKHCYRQVGFTLSLAETCQNRQKITPPKRYINIKYLALLICSRKYNSLYAGFSSFLFVLPDRYMVKPPRAVGRTATLCSDKSYCSSYWRAEPTYTSQREIHPTKSAVQGNHWHHEKEVPTLSPTAGTSWALGRLRPRWQWKVCLSSNITDKQWVSSKCPRWSNSCLWLQCLRKHIHYLVRKFNFVFKEPLIVIFITMYFIFFFASAFVNNFLEYAITPRWYPRKWRHQKQLVAMVSAAQSHAQSLPAMHFAPSSCRQ